MSLSQISFLEKLSTTLNSCISPIWWNPGVSDPLESALFSVHTFSMCLSQETLHASLQSFHQERLSEITDLKDKLVAAEHSQTKAIEERHAALLRRWEQLLEASEVHRQELLEKQRPLLEVKKKNDAPSSDLEYLYPETDTGNHV